MPYRGESSKLDHHRAWLPSSAKRGPSVCTSLACPGLQQPLGFSLPAHEGAVRCAIVPWQRGLPSKEHCIQNPCVNNLRSCGKRIPHCSLQPSSLQQLCSGHLGVRCAHAAPASAAGPASPRHGHRWRPPGGSCRTLWPGGQSPTWSCTPALADTVSSCAQSLPLPAHTSGMRGCRHSAVLVTLLCHSW